MIRVANVSPLCRTQYGIICQDKCVITCAEMSCWPITVVWYATMYVRHGDITCNIDDTSRESYSPMITTENCACHITVIGNTISEHNFQTVCGQVKRKSKSNAKYALCSILLLESLWRLRVKIPFFCPWHRQGGVVDKSVDRLPVVLRGQRPLETDLWPFW